MSHIRDTAASACLRVTPRPAHGTAVRACSRSTPRSSRPSWPASVPERASSQRTSLCGNSSPFFVAPAPRPRLRPVDRAFWGGAFARVASVGGHPRGREARYGDQLAPRGFVRFWARRSRRAGRPPLDPAIVELIVRMVRENPTWSRRRIASELAKLGHVVSKDTVARYMPRQRPRSRPPSQTWGTFVRNHLPGTIAIDFLTVPTATFGVLYVFFVLSLERRRVLHVNVSAHPVRRVGRAADDRGRGARCRRRARHP